MENEKIKKGFKKCSCCKNIFKASLRNFYKDIAHIDGLSNTCVSCQRRYSTNYHQRNREYRNIYQTLYSQMTKRKSNPLTLSDFISKVENFKWKYNIGSNKRSYV